MAIGHVLARGPHQTLLRNKQKRLFKSFSFFMLFISLVFSIFRTNPRSDSIKTFVPQLLRYAVVCWDKNYYILFNFKPIEGGRFKNKNNVGVEFRAPLSQRFKNRKQGSLGYNPSLLIYVSPREGRKVNKEARNTKMTLFSVFKETGHEFKYCDKI